MAHQRSRKGRSIDTVRWGGSNLFFAAQAAGASGLTFITDGATETLMRIRGELVAWIDGNEAPAVAVDVAIGALVVSGDLGTSVFQTPITEPEAPWLFYERFTLGFEEYVTDVIDAPGLSVMRKSIDSKAMRILRPGREVQMVVEAATLSGAASVNVSFCSRVLLGTA